MIALVLREENRAKPKPTRKSPVIIKVRLECSLRKTKRKSPAAVEAFPEEAMMKLILKNFYRDFSKKIYIMGFLNITPDSFSDGGLYFDKAVSIERAHKMVEEGANSIDIGGESTKP